jgi:hypothetical protein
MVNLVTLSAWRDAAENVIMSPSTPFDTPPTPDTETMPPASSELAPAEAAPEAVDLVSLAEKVLALFKQELRVELERGRPHRLR